MNKKHMKVIICVVVVVLAFIVIAKVQSSYKNQLSFNAKEEFYDAMLITHKKYFDLAEKYFDSGMTKKEAIKSLVERGCDKDDADFIISKTWG